MEKITGFIFTPTDNARVTFDDDECLHFNTPTEAIEHFNAKGYGMSNWSIEVMFKHETNDKISLKMFNYLTDNWKQLTFDLSLIG